MTDFPAATIERGITTVTVTLTEEQANSLYDLFNTPCVVNAVPLAREVRGALNRVGLMGDPRVLGAHIRIRDSIIESLQRDGLIPR